MHRTGLNQAVEYLRGKPIDVCLNTALSIPLTLSDISLLEHVCFLLLSFPSSDKNAFRQMTGTNNYDTVLANIAKLSACHLALGVNQVVTRMNRGTVYSTGEFLHKTFGIRTFSATPAIPVRESMLSETLTVSETREVATDLRRLEDDLGLKTDMLACVPNCLFPSEFSRHRMASHACSAGKYTIVVSPNGMVRQCAALRTLYGSLFEEDLQRLWATMTEPTPADSKSCDACVFLPDCKGGCYARSLLLGRDPLVCGQDAVQHPPRQLGLAHQKLYRIKRFRYRTESGEFLISDGNAHITGNKALLDLMVSLENIPFSLVELRNTCGVEGEKLMTALFHRGLLEEAPSQN